MGGSRLRKTPTLERIARALDVERGSEEWPRLHELAVEDRIALPPDVVRFAAETPPGR